MGKKKHINFHQPPPATVPVSATASSGPRRFLYVALIAAAGLLVYANSMDNPFVWDQEVVILGNPIITSWRNLPEVFTTNVEGRELKSIGFYRPMEVMSYMFDYWRGGFNPAAFHHTSIALHIINALLAFRLLGLFGLPGSAAFLTALIFVIHPVNCEAVTYSIRGDLLATLFCLLSFNLLLTGGRRAGLWAALSVLCNLLALMSKEWAVVLPFVVGAWLALLKYLPLPATAPGRAMPGAASVSVPWRRANSIALGCMFAASIAYALARVWFISAGAHTALSLIAAAPLGQRLLTLPRILLTYAGMFIFPLNLHMEYMFVVRSAASPWFWGGLAAVAGGAWLLARYIRRVAAESPFEGRMLIFFAFWFFGSLGPFYNIFVTLHATLLQNWAYFAGIGFIAGCVLAAQREYRRRPRPARAVLAAAFAILAIYYSGYTLKRNWEWKDPMRLYKHDLACEPDSFILHNNVGVISFRQGDFKTAKEEFTRAIEVSPGRRYDVAYNNLAVILENEGNYTQAEELYRQSIELTDYELAYGNLVRLYLNQGRLEEAVRTGERGLRIYPRNPDILYCLGNAYYLSGRREPALKLLEALRSVNPDFKNVSQVIEKIRSTPQDGADNRKATP